MSDLHANRAPDRDGPTSEQSRAKYGRAEFARRALIAAVLAGAIVAGGVAVVRAADVLFLFFLSILCAILLRTAADALARLTGLGSGWSLAVIVVALAIAAAGGAYAIGSFLAGQADEFAAELPRAAGQARDYLRQSAAGRWVLEHTPSADSLVFGDAGSTTPAVTSFFSTTLGILGDLLVLAFLTLYLAADPKTYVRGLLTLVPPRHRDRAAAVVAAVGYHLRWWLVGRLAAMLIVGFVVGVGLRAVGVPQFLALALLAAAVNCVPYLGPIAAAVPGVLLALVQGPATAAGALGVYLAAQSIDNYLVTPLVQQRTVNMPPVLSILAVVLVGALFGVLGLIAAAPLAVVAMVAVKMLYVEDVLGDRLGVSGAERWPAVVTRPMPTGGVVPSPS